MFNRVGELVKPLFMVDGSVRVLIDFGELTPEEISELYRMKLKGNINVFIAPSADLDELRSIKEGGE